MKKTIFTTFIFLIFINISFSQSNVEDIKEFRLDNGMKILVLEDFSIPNANMYLFWKVGSRNEYPGITGLSHFFEHMMFNGSEKYGPKMFDKTMESVGGSNNAYTTENLTVYTNWFPVSSMETIFDLESDSIGSLGLRKTKALFVIHKKGFGCLGGRTFPVSLLLNNDGKRVALFLFLYLWFFTGEQKEKKKAQPKRLSFAEDGWLFGRFCHFH